MTKTHLRGRYGAAVRLAVVGLRAVELSVVLAGMLLAVCPRAFALNPALDVSQYAHTAWKIRDGFVKGPISSIAQTPDGYLWIGTEFGLYRFDGVRALPWQPPPSQHLSSNFIGSLLAARDGTLWIGTLKGLATWRDGKFTEFPELAGLYISRLLEDREGTVWVGTLAMGGASEKLCAIHKGSVHCYGEDGALGRGVVGLYEDSKGTLWVGVLNGLWRWSPGPPKFYPLGGEANGIQAIGEDQDGTLLVGWKGGIRRFFDGETEVYPLPGTVQQFHANRLLRDRDGGLWIATFTQGLIHVHEGRADLFTQTDGLSGDDITTSFGDREGDIWIGTLSGLDRFRDFAVGRFTVKGGFTNCDCTKWRESSTQGWKHA